MYVYMYVQIHMRIVDIPSCSRRICVSFDLCMSATLQLLLSSFTKQKLEKKGTCFPACTDEQANSGYPLFSPSSWALTQAIINVVYQLQSQKKWSLAISKALSSRLAPIITLLLHVFAYARYAIQIYALRVRYVNLKMNLKTLPNLFSKIVCNATLLIKYLHVSCDIISMVSFSLFLCVK